MEEVAPGKVLYTGPAEGGRFRHRHHAFHTCSNLLLRLLTIGATAATIIVLLKSSQTIRTSSGGRNTARWTEFSAFKWLLVANAIVFVYAVIAAIIAFLAVCIRRGPLSYGPSAWLTFLLDFLAASAIMSASSAALAILWIKRNGQPTAGWGATCNYVSKFCDHIQGAIIASFCGWAFLSLSTLLAVAALHHLAMPRY